MRYGYSVPDRVSALDQRYYSNVVSLPGRTKTWSHWSLPWSCYLCRPLRPKTWSQVCLWHGAVACAIGNDKSVMIEGILIMVDDMAASFGGWAIQAQQVKGWSRSEYSQACFGHRHKFCLVLIFTFQVHSPSFRFSNPLCTFKPR